MKLARFMCRVGSPAFVFFSGIGVSIASNIMVACITLPANSLLSGKVLFASSLLWLLSSLSAFVIGSKIAGFDANYSGGILHVEPDSSAPMQVHSRSDYLVQQVHDGVRFKFLWLCAMLSGPAVGGLLILQAKIPLLANLFRDARSVMGL